MVLIFVDDTPVSKISITIYVIPIRKKTKTLYVQKLWINRFILRSCDTGQKAKALHLTYCILIYWYGFCWMNRNLNEVRFLNSTVLSYSFQFNLCLQPEPATEPPSALVPFLQKYADVSNKKQSVSISLNPRQRKWFVLYIYTT